MLADYVKQTASQADAESDALRTNDPQHTNRSAAAIAVTAALSLTIINFYAKRVGWVIDVAGWFGADAVAADWLNGRDSRQLARLVVWTVVQLFAYVGLPVLVIRILLGQRVGEFGTKWRGTLAHWKPYVALFLVSLPVVIWASYAASFQSKYPFYELAIDESLWPNMWIWWAMYAVQFVALEFFFRGFLVHGLKMRMGFAAVFVMIIPYNMIHFGKPITEALGAILGGVTLGTLSLRNRSVWWGAALHIAVAATMDIAALTHKGLLWP